MKKPTLSLQTRLTLLVLGSVLLFGTLAGYESYKNALHEADELFDAQLAQFAQSLMLVANDLDDDRTASLPPSAHKYRQEFVFEIWATEDGETRLLLRSNEDFSLPARDFPEEEFSNGTWNGRHWRFYRQRDPEREIDVLVGQSDKARNELAREVAWHNITPFLFGLPLLGLLSLLAIRLGLKPLRDLALSLRKLSPEQLAPVEMHAAPQEITPVLEALNGLLARTAGMMENERRFTADAAHELRTPLAALQAQLQAAQLAADAGERNHSLGQAMQGTHRMSHLVGQLLTLSRLDEQQALRLLEPVDLLALTQTCSAELAPQALVRDITLEVTTDTAITVSAAEDLLHIMLRNLLDNAIRYTPQGGQIKITLHPAAHHAATLTITDSGSGVAEAQLPLLGKRFSRLASSGTEGVGLGLSIVLRIAALHGARVEFRNEEQGGLTVSVHFPPKA
ncbi:MAG: ATP-binding protein [Gallionella sp.]|nr:ATP-binding protein [Gallionella sp.]